MNKTEIEKLLREVTNFAESMKLNFGNAQVIRQEIAKIVILQKELNQINTKIERELKHLGFTSFFENAVGNVGNVVNNVFNGVKTGGKVAVGVGTLAAGIGLLSIGFDLRNHTDFLSSMGSEFSFDFGQDVFINGIDQLSSIKGNKTKNNQFSNTKGKTEYLKLGLLSLQKGINNLIQQGEKLKAIGHYCLKNPDLLICFDSPIKTIDIKSLEDNCNNLQKSLKLLFSFDKPNIFKEQANHFTKNLEDFECQKQLLSKILQTFNTNIDESPVAIGNFLAVFGNTIINVHFDGRKEALDIALYASKKCIVKGKDIQQKYTSLEKRISQVITQCNYLKSFVLTYSFTETLVMKEFAKYHNNRIRGEIEYKKNEICKPIKLNLFLNYKTIKIEINNIYAIQQSLEEIEKK